MILIVQKDYLHKIPSTLFFRCKTLEQSKIKIATVGITIHY